MGGGAWCGVRTLLKWLAGAGVWFVANIGMGDWSGGSVPVTVEAPWRIDVGELLSAADPRTADVPNGIAWHAPSGRLWVSGKHWPWLFCLQVALPPIAPAATPQ